MEIIKKEISDMVYEIINEPLIEKRKLLCQINGLDYGFVVNYGPYAKFEQYWYKNKNNITIICLSYIYIDQKSIQIEMREHSTNLWLNDDITMEISIPIEFFSEYTLEMYQRMYQRMYSGIWNRFSHNKEHDVDAYIQNIKSIVESILNGNH